MSLQFELMPMGQTANILKEQKVIMLQQLLSVVSLSDTLNDDVYCNDQESQGQNTRQ